MDFSVRSYQKELLDGNDIPLADIKQNMEELDRINALLGGHAITLSGFKKLSFRHNQVTICEIGCGGGDNLRAINEYCLRKSISASFLGIDINPDCIEVAKNNAKDSRFRFAVSDYRDFDFGDTKPDIIFSSLFCHHFKEPELKEMLIWMYTHTRIGFFINDLHRHPFAYHSIRMLTRLFSRSYLVKNDAPLSVLRGFRRREWSDLLEQTKIPNFTIQWKWAFRWLICARVDN
jgi:SAM-dependent methyltransferase